MEVSKRKIGVGFSTSHQTVSVLDVLAQTVGVKRSHVLQAIVESFFESYDGEERCIAIERYKTIRGNNNVKGK